MGTLSELRSLVGTVDSVHVVLVGRDPEKAGEPTETTEIERMEWVPLASVPGLISAGEIWNSGTLVGLMRLLSAVTRWPGSYVSATTWQYASRHSLSAGQLRWWRRNLVRQKTELCRVGLGPQSRVMTVV